MDIRVHDRVGYAVSHRELLDNGYLKVPGRVARTGIQRYLASELCLNDRDPNGVVAVYRPPEEVFATDSLATYDNSDTTLEHPDDLVNAATYRGVSVGHATSPGRQDGDFVVVDLLIKDQEAIKAIDAGKCELSAGYTAEYVPESGVTDAGEAYEFVQRRIRINHIALVDQARAGRDARLFDRKPKEAITMTHVTLDNGATVEVADKATAQLLQSTFDGLRKRAEDAEQQIKIAKDEAEAEKAKADTLKDENEELKEKASEDSVSKRVESVIAAMDGARKLAGDEFTCDSVNPVEIKRAALAKALPKRDWADRSEAYIAAAWDAEMERKEAEDEEEEAGKKASADSRQKLSQDMQGARLSTDAQKTIDSAYDAAMQRKANAWKEAQ